MADRLELYQSHDSEFRWRLKAANGEIVSVSGEGFTRLRDARRSAERVHPGVAVYVMEDDGYAPFADELASDEERYDG